MSLTGQVEKVSRCCKARLEPRGSYPSFYGVCGQCGAGHWPDGVAVDFVYRPSDYEKALEARIEALEKTVADLLALNSDSKDPHDSPEYQAFVASMVPHCHCREGNRPCDGVLAGGICDDIQEPEDDFDSSGDLDDEDYERTAR